MRSFLNPKKPIIVAMVKNFWSLEDILNDVKFSLENGAEAFGLEIDQLEGELRTRENLTKIFSAMGDCPCYVTDYTRGNKVEGLSDEELYAELKLAVECGAKLVDLRGDMFLPTEGEITDDETAVARQKEAIEELHNMGVEVLMSTHTLKYITPAQVMELAEKQHSRGTDIIKIVIDSNDKDQLKDAFNNTFDLYKKFGNNFLFLVNGRDSYAHRLSAPYIAGNMYLCSADPNAVVGVGQPPVKDAVMAVNLMKWN